MRKALGAVQPSPPLQPHIHAMRNRKGDLAMGGKVEPEVGSEEIVSPLLELLAQELGEQGTQHEALHAGRRQVEQAAVVVE